MTNPQRYKGRTLKASPAIIAGRFDKAKSFLEVAEQLLGEPISESETKDAAVNLYVLSGIASSDVLCGQATGQYAQGDSDTEAIKLLASVDKEAAQSLKNLLSLKTKASYRYNSISINDFKSAQRSARKHFQ